MDITVLTPAPTGFFKRKIVHSKIGKIEFFSYREKWKIFDFTSKYRKRIHTDNRIKKYERQLMYSSFISESVFVVKKEKKIVALLV